MTMKENDVFYNETEVFEKSLEYFNGDELATSSFIKKYALKNSNGQYLEVTPNDMHSRLAKEFYRIEQKYNNPLDYDTIYKTLENFKYIVPGGSVMYGAGNNYVYTSLSNCVVVDSPSDDISGIMETGKQMANLYKYRAGCGVCIDTLRPDGAHVNNSAGSSTGAWSFSEYFSQVCKMIGQCLHKNTLILTECGLVKIKDVNVGDKVWTQSGWVDVIDKIKNNKKLVKLTTKFGKEILCSKDHIFHTIDGEKKVEDMNIGDPITQIIGGGWEGKDVTLDNYDPKQQPIHKADARLSYLAGNICGISDRDHKMYYDFPEKLLLAKQDIVFAFLSGYFDVLGRISNKTGSYKFCSKNKEFLMIVQNILMAFGIISKLSQKGDFYNLKIKDMESKKLLFTYMKDSIRIKNSDNKQCYYNKDENKNNILLQDFVKDIAYLEYEDDVYDLVLEKEHLFFANGLYAHNSGRRGALLIAMSVKHPDIEKFVTMKRDLNKVTGANISVFITDDFMQAVENDQDWVLQWPVDVPIEEAKYIKKIKAKSLWDLICESAVKYAEPGVIFIDNYKNNLPANEYPDFVSVATNPCVPDTTWVMTSEGAKQVKDLIGKQFNAVVNGKNYLSTPDGFFSTGEKPIIEITTNKGYKLEATEDHQVLINRNKKHEWEKIRNLKIGDKIVLNNHADYEWDGEYNFEQGWILGSLVGDGSLIKHSISNYISKNIEKTSSNCYIGFIKYLFAKNGDVAITEKGKDIIQLSSYSSDVLSTVQRMLLRLGIVSKICKNNALVWNPIYELQISNKHILTFKNRIGFDDIDRNEKLEKLINQYIVGINKESFTDKVKTIVEIDKQEVYDCQISNINAFDANGFYAHNCGEVLLSKNDTCRLTSINLKSFVLNSFKENAYFDYDKLTDVVKIAVHILDDIVDLEIEKLEQIKEKADNFDEKRIWEGMITSAKNGRRVGLGIVGLADALACLTIKYDSDQAINEIHKIFGIIRDASYKESINLSKDRGAFPHFDWEIEKNNIFIKRLPQNIQNEIAIHGRRNISLLTVPPTGTISILAETSSGIEPVFQNAYIRRVKINDSVDSNVSFVDDSGDKWREFAVFHNNINDFLSVNPDIKALYEQSNKTKNDDLTVLLKQILPEYFVTAHDIDPLKRAEIQGVISYYLDHGVSSTVNMKVGTTIEQGKELYQAAYQHGCKGITLYVDGSRSGVLITKNNDTKLKESVAAKRPDILSCDIHHSTIDDQKWTIFVGMLDGKPYEIFGGLSEYVTIPKKYKTGKIVKTKNGKKNVNGRWAFYNLIIDDGDDDPLEVQNIAVTFNNGNYAAQTRMISLALRHGVPVQYITEQLGRDENSEFFSFSKVMARVLKKYIVDGTEGTDLCETCHEKLRFEGGCQYCPGCGNSTKCS